MKRILFVVGCTATGKTSIGIKIAKKLNGEIISCDSRQVYKGMDIGTGKDNQNCEFVRTNLKHNGEKIVYFNVDGVRVWGYDLVEPNEKFSVAHYLRLAWIIIDDIWKRGKLPIVVGGTGMYLRNLLNPAKTIYIPINVELRKKLVKFSLDRLQRKLKMVDASRYSRMNNSDKKNSRRLIRAIEVSLFKKGLGKDFKGLDFERETKKGSELASNKEKVKKGSSLWIGLKIGDKKLSQRIEKRVISRIREGMSIEVNRLIEKYNDWSLPAFTSTGYKEWRSFIEGDISDSEAVDLWVKREIQYAKRQKTWFKKQADIEWFNPLKEDVLVKVVEKIKNWYS